MKWYVFMCVCVCTSMRTRGGVHVTIEHWHGFVMTSSVKAYEVVCIFVYVCIYMSRFVMASAGKAFEVVCVYVCMCVYMCVCV